MNTAIRAAVVLALAWPAFGAPVEVIRDAGEPAALSQVSAALPTNQPISLPTLAAPALERSASPSLEAPPALAAAAAAAQPVAQARPSAQAAPLPVATAMARSIPAGYPASQGPSSVDFDGSKSRGERIESGAPEAPQAYQPPKGYEALDADQRSPEVEKFEKYMKSKVIDQDAAVDSMVRVFQRIDAGLTRPGRPLGNVMVLGPTGTGKTRLFEAMAEYMFGDKKAMIKIDGAEFQHSHEVAKLIGSPPGYLGHRETHPLLTQEALNQWHNEKYKVTLLLFDEVEKASDAVWNLLLGIMDKANLTLGDNRRVNFENVIIGFTSNVGAQQMQDLLNPGLGFNAGAPKSEKVDRQVEEVALNAMRSKFSPEFLNRVDEKVVAKKLSPAAIARIVDLELQEVQDYFDKQQSLPRFQFAPLVTPAAKRLLAEVGFDKNYGARPLKREVERRLTNKFANMIKTGQIKTGDQIIVDTEGPGSTKLVFLKKKGVVGQLVDQVRR